MAKETIDQHIAKKMRGSSSSSDTNNNNELQTNLSFSNDKQKPLYRSALPHMRLSTMKRVVNGTESIVRYV